MSLPVRQQWTPERMAFVQTLLNEFPLYETRKKLPSGFYLGMPIFMQDGRLLRVSQSEEPNQSGQEYGLVPGRVSYYAGSEFSVVQDSTTAERIVGERGGNPVRGDKRIKITGITASYDKGSFDSGYMRITGGLVKNGLGTTLMVGDNEKSVSRTATSAEASRDSDITTSTTVYDMTLYLAVPLPFDLTSDTDILVQGNPYSCQRFSVAASVTALDFPQFHTGTPLVKVPEDHYYWNVVGGPAQGITQDGITAANCETDKIELSPFYSTGDTTDNNADMGKLVVTSYADAAHNAEQPFARLFTRSKTAFTADSFIPIWIYPK